jgi:predicted nucleic acid-binding protein
LTFVVDASVAVKWFMAEPDSPAARAVRAGPDRIVAPELVLAEIMSATWTAMRRGQLLPQQFTTLVPTMPRFFDELAPLGGLTRRTAAIAQQLDHPVYDCFYLALAEREAAQLVTADRRLARRLAGTPWAGTAVDLASFARHP